MALSWWDIPGPSRYVQRIEKDLNDRVNVVAALPEGYGQDWLKYFRWRRIDTQEHLEVLRMPDDNTSPLDVLCTTFTTSPLKTLTIGALIKNENFLGRTLGIYLDKSGQVKDWMDFSSAYELECRRVSQMDRTVLLITTNGICPEQLPAQETNLRVHLYDGYARPKDCYMYAWALLKGVEKQSWRTELKIALSSQLSWWDPYLCEKLSGMDLASILRPESMLNNCKREMSHSSEDGLDEGWAKGILQRYENEVVYHSGWLAGNALSDELDRRLWTAQVQVIFPLIEHVRRKTIEKYKKRLRCEIDDPYELEIKEVRYHLSKIEDVPKSILRQVDHAYDFRNALAHLKSLTIEQILGFEPFLDAYA